MAMVIMLRVYGGTTVTMGNATAVVTGTGVKTALGRIHVSLLSNANKRPLILMLATKGRPCRSNWMPLVIDWHGSSGSSVP